MGSGLYRRSWTSHPTPFVSAQRLSELPVYRNMVKGDSKKKKTRKMYRFWNVTFRWRFKHFTLKGDLDEYDCWRFARKGFHENRSFLTANLLAKKHYKYSFCLMVEASDHVYVWPQTCTCHTYSFTYRLYFLPANPCDTYKSAVRHIHDPMLVP